MHDKGSTQLRIGELFTDLLSEVQQTHSCEWPLPDYAEAAAKCTSLEDLEKLRSLCDDLESIFTSSKGLGNAERIARDSTGQFRRLYGRSFRDILTDAALDTSALLLLRNLSEVFLAKEMDAATRRAAMVVNAVVNARLEARNTMPVNASERQRLEEQRQFVLSRIYLPRYISEILRGDVSNKGASQQ